ncbi:glycerophosphodiester phosphodiesterase [Nocardioides zeae]|uniref:Glycerophosphodiester phosphodiesterase n=1 Tax=Nocardioides imazamoxiresistens TaxID=3231893 RepID=A0ABU3PSX2_9ACTN|nr:glycerophosphodiester phosphodiesterase [Nocardioides zeae]MDT9592337.1 glycerophosphodiester phosphodiesterase [Nocardioides zeae]
MTARTTAPSTGFAYLDGDETHGGVPLAFAHRGGAEHPDLVGAENTLEAFEHAAALGYVHLETDVQVTSDGHLVAFHDARTLRVTEVEGSVGGLSLAEVKGLLVGRRGQVPTLAELVDALPRARFNIDLKCDRSPAALARFVAERGLWDRVLVGSFSAGRLRRFRRLTGGRVPTAAHRAEIVAFLLLPARLADRVTGGRVAALQVPVHRGVTIVTPRLVRRAHAVGKHVHVWTVDDPAEMERLLDLGVDGLMTDRTDLLRSVLEARGAWRPVEEER